MSLIYWKYWITRKCGHWSLMGWHCVPNMGCMSVLSQWGAAVTCPVVTSGTTVAARTRRLQLQTLDNVKLGSRCYYFLLGSYHDPWGLSQWSSKPGTPPITTIFPKQTCVYRSYIHRCAALVWSDNEAELKLQSAEPRPGPRACDSSPSDFIPSPGRGQAECPQCPLSTVSTVSTRASNKRRFVKILQSRRRLYFHI